MQLVKIAHELAFTSGLNL
ncbi:unnamed protein product, partial [Didymodactylos carnosus]